MRYITRKSRVRREFQNKLTCYTGCMRRWCGLSSLEQPRKFKFTTYLLSTRILLSQWHLPETYEKTVCLVSKCNKKKEEMPKRNYRMACDNTNSLYTTLLCRKLIKAHKNITVDSKQQAVASQQQVEPCSVLIFTFYYLLIVKHQKNRKNCIRPILRF